MTVPQYLPRKYLTVMKFSFSGSEMRHQPQGSPHRRRQGLTPANREYRRRPCNQVPRTRWIGQCEEPAQVDPA